MFSFLLEKNILTKIFDYFSKKLYLKYFKTQQISKEIIFTCIVNIVIPATNLAKTVANTSYSLLEYLHGIPGGQRFESAWLHL